MQPSKQLVMLVNSWSGNEFFNSRLWDTLRPGDSFSVGSTKEQEEANKTLIHKTIKYPFSMTYDWSNRNLHSLQVQIGGTGTS